MKLRSYFIFLFVSAGLLYSQTDPAKFFYGFYHEKSQFERAKNLNRLAVYYLNSNLDSAKKYASIMVDFVRKTRNNRWIARALFYHADVEGKQNNFSGQIYYLEQGCKVLEKIHDSVGMAKGYNRMALLYTQLHEMDRALQMMERFVAVSICLKDTMYFYQWSRANCTMGEICLYQKDYKKALQYFDLAATQSIKGLLTKWMRADLFYQTGQAYAGLHNYEKALEYYRQALIRNQEEDNTDAAIRNQSAIADVYMKTGKLSEAEQLLVESKALIPKVMNKRVLLDFYSRFIDLYEAKKDHEKRSEYLQLYSELNHIIDKQTFSENLALAKTKYETNEKEKENFVLLQKTRLQDLELRNNRLMTTVLFAAVLFFLLLSFLIFNQYRLRNRQKTLETEQKLLRSQMNPHFLFNSLMAIESFVYSNEPKTAGLYLSSFAKLMRLILENSREDYISLQQEIDTLKHYLELQKLRFDNGFDYTIHITANIDVDATLIPPMLAQPFIENSIEHGLMNIKRKGAITIQFYREKDHLLFEVSDNGPGFSTDIVSASKQHRSLATQITNERLKLFNKRKRRTVNLYEENIKNASDEVMGGRVKFVIPYNTL
jgi:tetratricopeptide (TPR) repeat protein